MLTSLEETKVKCVKPDTNVDIVPGREITVSYYLSPEKTGSTLNIFKQPKHNSTNAKLFYATLNSNKLTVSGCFMIDVHYM